ncbi:MAG: hypothetical protein HXL66_00745 [Capnocytophaga sp.]|nr:hypothetical protein [Capnocytophaga sp.]
MKRVILIFLMINSYIYGQEINSLAFLLKNPDKVTISTIFSKIRLLSLHL